MNIDMLFYLNNTYMLHFTFRSILYALSVCVHLLQNRVQHTLNVIGHYIVWFLFDLQISLRLEIHLLSLSWSSCENFRSLAEAECNAVPKMIVQTISLVFDIMCC